MEGLRVVLRDDAPIEDSARIVLSIDELYRILTWANSDIEAARSRDRSTTWRVVPGLALRQVRPGSSILELFAELARMDSVVVVGVLTHWILKIIEPKYRAEVRAVDANTRKTIAEAREKEIANEMAEETNNLTLWREAAAIAKDVREIESPAIYDDRSDAPAGPRRRAGDAVSRVPRLPQDLRQRINAILNSGDVGEELFDQIYKPARSRGLPPSRSFQATEDGARAFRRIDRHQRGSRPVERLEVIDDGR